MKANIHPVWYPEAKVTCACGNTFTLGLTVPSLTVEVCYNCHPYYTGQMKFVDIAGRVEAFRVRQAGAKKVISKVEKRRLKRLKKIEEERERPTSLEELRKSKKRS
ncbi:50S ribosomal protein L31 [Candidatus Woesebacteria bacterium]|nr:50S ribosomal protein L31 [Candidatus Woesebacteria bacterium]